MLETLRHRGADVLLDKVQALLNRIFKNQRDMTSSGNRAVDENMRVLARNFDDLPEPLKKQMRQGNGLFDDMMKSKGDEGGRANL